MISTDSILDSVKEYCNIDASDTCFDRDILYDINSAFLTLRQIGVGPIDGFYIEDRQSKWEDFMSGYVGHVVQDYVCNKVRLKFDPPTNGTVLQALKDAIAEDEFRLNGEAEHHEVVM